MAERGVATRDENFASDLKSHGFETLRLALPVMLARAGILLMVLIDAAMVGQVAARELAFMSIGIAPQVMLMLIGVGMLQGGMVLTAQAHGAGENEATGEIWRVNLAHAAVLGLFFGFASLLAEPFIRAVGIAPDLAAGAGRVSIQFAWGIPGMLLYISCQYFLEGIKRPYVCMSVMGVANVINIFLNGIIVWGWFGWVTPMGAEGAVLATSSVRWLLFISVFIYILSFRERHAYAIHLEWRDIVSEKGRDIGRRIRRIGAPAGLTQFLESSAFSALVILAGLIGEIATAAYQVTINIVQFLYMAAVGMAAATSVRVGSAVGSGDLPGVRLAGWSGAFLVVLITMPFALMLLIWPGPAAQVFVSDPAVIELARVTIRLACLFILLDVAMAVLLGALRGAGDMHVPMGLQSVSFWVVTVPIAYFLAIGQKMGAPGLILGLFVGVSLACVLLGLRFRKISQRPIKRR